MLIEELINVPNEALVNNIIPKQDVIEVAHLNKSDVELFRKYVKQMRWLYKFDDDTIRLKPYISEEKEYVEVEFINIDLKEENFQIYNRNTGNLHRYDARLDRIVDVILRFIPYPILLSAQFKDEIKFYVSHISESKADAEKITLDELINTDWIDVNNMDSFDEELIDNLQLDNLDKTNTFTFYDSIIKAIIQYNGSKEVGTSVSLDTDEIQEIMDEIKTIERKIDGLRADMKKVDNFNEKVELNIQIKELQMDINLLQEKLK